MKNSSIYEPHLQLLFLLDLYPLIARNPRLPPSIKTIGNFQFLLFFFYSNHSTLPLCFSMYTKLCACCDIQQASSLTYFLTLISSVFLNQFNAWLLSHHKSCSCTHKPVALVRLHKVVIIHYQQNEILVWSTSSKYRVLKFVIHKNKKEDKNETTTVDTEMVDYNRDDLWMVSPKQRKHTQTHQILCPA